MLLHACTHARTPQECAADAQDVRTDLLLGDVDVFAKANIFLAKRYLTISKRQTKGCKCSRCTGRRAGNRMMMRVMMMMVMMMTMTAYHSHVVVVDDADESGGGDHGDDKSHRFVWHNLKVGWL